MVWIIVSGQVRNSFQFSEIVFMKFSPGRLWTQHSNWSRQRQPKHKDMKLLAVERNWNIFLWREQREWDDGEKWALIMDVCVCVRTCSCARVWQDACGKTIVEAGDRNKGQKGTEEFAPSIFINKGFWMIERHYQVGFGRPFLGPQETNQRKLRLEAENAASRLLHAGTAIVNVVICKRCKLAWHLSSTEVRWWDW